MEENNNNIVVKDLLIKKITKQNKIFENSFKTYKNYFQKDKKYIQSYLYKNNNYNILTKKKSQIQFDNFRKNYDTLKLNENSTRINSIKLTRSTNCIKSKLEETMKSTESLNNSKILSKKKIINLKKILYPLNINNAKNKYNLFNPKRPTIINDKNINSEDCEDSGLKRYLLKKFKLVGNKTHIENTILFKKQKKTDKKYFSLTNIQRYNDLINFKTFRKNLFNKDKNIEENISNISYNSSKKQLLKFIKNKNGIYILSKSCKPQFNKKRKQFFKKQLSKYNTIRHNNTHLYIHNFDNIKYKINKDNEKIDKKIKKSYSNLEILKNNLYSKRPNENTHEGLNELFYLYNKKRAKKDKIITNRILGEENDNIPIAEMIYNLDNDIDKNKKYNIINSKNITYLAQKKVNKLFHDLLIFQLPKLSNEKYNRNILYDIFIEFKNLLLLSMMKNKDINIDKKGIDFNTFFNCNTKINQQGKIIAKKIFQIFNNKTETKYMKLNNYIDGMLKMKDTNKENKLDLFFEMLNNNSDGCLTYDDIYKLSIICLQKLTLNIEDEYNFEKYKKENDKDLKIVAGLAEYFCKMIFKLVKIDINEKIPIKLLKKMIIQGGEQADYIELLFGSANFI